MVPLPRRPLPSVAAAVITLLIVSPAVRAAENAPAWADGVAAERRQAPD